MRKREFVSERLERWNRLDRLIAQLESRRLKTVPTHMLDEFVQLYRIACSDLARARSEEMGDDVEGYLNMIVARGHKQFHPPRPPSSRVFRRFFNQRFPQAVRDIRYYVLAAALCFFLPICFAAVAVTLQPSLAYRIAPPEQLDMLTEAYAKGHHGGRGEGMDTLMMGYYINNNIGIAFRCFATGIFFGLGSIYFLLINGVLGGAIGAFICSAGYTQSFLSFVVGHGAFELTAIVLSGATGLRLGFLLVNPGPYRRLDALKIHASPMITVVLGAAAMLFIAALIEGFWSPSGAEPLIKFIIGGALWVLVIAYFCLVGRQPTAGDQTGHREGRRG